MEINILDTLNFEQKEAVKTTEGYVRVIAGAGSGKTKALTSRYIYLVDELGVSTANILCVTFTNKAANEMKKRIRKVIGDKDTALICTFHSFCRQLLREDIHTMNYPNNFIVMDIEDTNAILKIVYEQANISSSQRTYVYVRDMIAKRKAKLEHIPYILDLDSNTLKDKFLNSSNIDDRIFFGYLYQQRKSFNLDFSDLITFAVYILENFSEKREKWQKKLQYIMVDEFQDVSSLQYILVTVLSEYHKNLFVVGDPDQTIYSWRGARIEFILEFDKKFPNVKTIVMDTNYRSSENILKASNSLINKNRIRYKKELKAIKSIDIPVVYNHSRTIYDEAREIVSQINKLVKQGNSYNDICILYRAHHVSRCIEEAFIKENIPHVIYSGVSFYERKEIKDILSYLRMVAFEDDLSLIRVINEPKRNFGIKRMQIIQTYAEEKKCSLFSALKLNLDNNLIIKSKAIEFVNLIEKYQKVYKEITISDLLSGILNDSGYEAMLRECGERERLDNLAELKNSITDYENTAGEETSLEDYLQEIALYTNSDLKEADDKVKMMTIHAAKGLEFPYVFICGLNEGIFPSKRTDTIEALEEERRLAYVGYTRAEKALFISDAEGKNYDNSYRYPSRFIFNTDKRYLNYSVELNKELIDEANDFIISSEKKLSNANIAKFKINDRIIHHILGTGIIMDLNMDESSYLIKFDTSEIMKNLSFSAPLNLYDCNEDKNVTENKEDLEKVTDEFENENKVDEERERLINQIKAEVTEYKEKEYKKIKKQLDEFNNKEKERITDEILLKHKVEEEKVNQGLMEYKAKGEERISLELESYKKDKLCKIQHELSCYKKEKEIIVENELNKIHSEKEEEFIQIKAEIAEYKEKEYKKIKKQLDEFNNKEKERITYEILLKHKVEEEKVNQGLMEYKAKGEERISLELESYKKDELCKIQYELSCYKKEKEIIIENELKKIHSEKEEEIIKNNENNRILKNREILIDTFKAILVNKQMKRLQDKLEKDYKIKLNTMQSEIEKVRDIEIANIRVELEKEIEIKNLLNSKVEKLTLENEEKIDSEKKYKNQIDLLIFNQKKLEKKLHELEIKNKRIEIENNIKIQEIIISKNQFKFFGKGAKEKQMALNEINKLNNLLKEYNLVE